MSQTRRPGRRIRQIAAAVAILVILAASFFLAGPIISALRTVTAGNRAADAAAGVLLLIAPMTAVVGYAYLAYRRGWPQSWGWWLLVLYLPAFALEPFGRSGTNIALQQRVDTQLPGLLAGMLAGLLILVMLFVVPALVVTRLRRRRQTRRE
jgi:hypothetical protein